MSDDAEVRARASRVQQLILQKKFVEAVSTSLENPPVNAPDEATRVANAQTVFSALLACSKADIARTVQELTPDLEDNLMKYVYKGLSVPQNNSVFLEWHGQLAAKAGSGCIIRAMTDRKGV
ncbi:hypothetical protein SDRG_07910 [Saprolegnia diclina VS20]|uniref:Actin-related protein 2/3 complex subunit 5 n=1 Tax=Saprolegnia diclina (strain VS20) TaxID=1156394 RepID=T0QLA6_SAPDV|nr:hypothetical protein SDRG_07910 [Saprolegnia diclina VS20]EQC34585.1 hypothetical protein SDRG_07910 [Saprolegnia diclina VS20]|eukprot:XP_008611991.1 hypothetical protein SDRG_07910 [Saprolegnia diclina VS20]